jgi:hypothetical protein
MDTNTGTRFTYGYKYESEIPPASFMLPNGYGLILLEDLQYFTFTNFLLIHLTKKIKIHA